ncbi:plasminogen activator inhibitor 1 [Boleophthalmus pectinirostris]|uniref:plasminogen activator inhibitor 1 n=1 Tax=Boleophthalmus pectinirostris TaxID=150288 RepID=UPI0024304DD9|nr:plasminogen activator inhibitor 1 [Boleophthalmus pectinirostris]
MFALCICLLLTPAALVRGSLMDAQMDFGFKVFSGLSQDRSNQSVVFSPFGITAVMSLAQLGAGGHTHKALTAAMGFSMRERGMARQQRLLQRDVSAEEGVDVATGVLVERKMSIEKGYRRALAKAFLTHPHQVDFSRPEEAVSIINAWVSDNTNGAISNFLANGSLTEETRLVMLNALHFHGLWKVPFDPRLTQERMFLCANGTQTPVHMMRLTDRFHYGEFVTAGGVDYDVIEVPYEGDSLSMLLVSPFERDVPLSVLSTELTSHTLRRWREGMRLVKRQLAMPRFTLASDLDMKKVLSNMGLGNMFNLATADFTRITTDERLCVSKVLQKVTLEVNEHGTKGAAASAAVMFSRMAVEEITLDRPFLFMVQHKHTGAVLFMGQFNQPQP